MPSSSRQHCSIASTAALQHYSSCRRIWHAGGNVGWAASTDGGARVSVKRRTQYVGLYLEGASSESSCSVADCGRWLAWERAGQSRRSSRRWSKSQHRALPTTGRRGQTDAVERVLRCAKARLLEQWARAVWVEELADGVPCGRCWQPGPAGNAAGSSGSPCGLELRRGTGRWLPLLGRPWCCCQTH